MTTTSTTQTGAAGQRPTPPITIAGRYALDAAHSHVGFSVRHLMISNVRGEFPRVTGEISYDAARPEATTMSVSIEVASVNTREEKRDAHLRSADFFDVENHPTMTFVSKSALRGKDGGLDLLGDLTIRGTTREITLAIEDITPEQVDPWGGKRLGATAHARILRSDFGMTWNGVLEAGGFLVGDEVKILIEAELVRQA